MNTLPKLAPEPKDCPHCEGTGRIACEPRYGHDTGIAYVVRQMCPACKGRGVTPRIHANGR